MKNLALKLKLLLVVLLLLNNPIHAKIVSFDKNPDGITFNLDKGLMKVKICLDNMVEVKYTELPVFMDKPSLVVTNEWKTIPTFAVSENEKEIIISTAKLHVIVNKQSNSVKYTDFNGKTILSEDDSQSKSMTSATIAGIDVYNCTTIFNSPPDE